MLAKTFKVRFCIVISINTAKCLYSGKLYTILSLNEKKKN